MEAQPDHCSYTRVRNFLADYLDTSKAAAEVEMAEMADSQIKIIQKKSGNSGRRVFLLPLDPLSESDIRAVWNGSASVGKDANRIATNVHDNTGHDIGDIINFMADLEIATLENGTFKWKNL
jgi:hypothetical protein